MNYFDPTFQVDSSVGTPLVSIIRSKIRAWVTSSWFEDLVKLFDGSVGQQQNLDALLEQLELFSERWDFRRIARERGAQTDDEMRKGKGSARWLSATTGLPREAELRIVDDARHLGLVHSEEPKQSFYDYMLVLGGARLSCKLRPVRAAEVVGKGVRVGKVALLGAARPVSETERDVTDTYAPGAADEFDLIVAGAGHAFNFDPSTFREQRYDDPANRNLGWVVRDYQASLRDSVLSIIAISAPSSDPNHRRANSADTITFLLDHESVQAGSKLLLITSQIYVPYVQLESLRTVSLPRNIMVETIGFPGDRMPELQGLSNPNHYLQEVRSTIQSARRFCLAYPQ